ncbi:hypothetical protein ACU1JV_03335 [Paenibacillus sp. T2-29]
MSERQFELRRDRETSGSAAEATGTDGKDYSRQRDASGQATRIGV